MSVRFKKITIVGAGLIGGSFARKCRSKGVSENITAFGRGEQNLQCGVDLGILNSYSLSLEEAVQGADLIFLSPPVESIISVSRKLAPLLAPGTIVTDAGSVKEEIVDELGHIFNNGVRFVGGHPIAGIEKGGIEASFESLFEGAVCILTPVKSTDKAALNTVEEIWTLLGADVIKMDPVKHDRILGVVSHLPHVAAYALCKSVSDINRQGGEAARIAAGGFKDITRIASSAPGLWREISLMNRENLLDMIDDFQRNLDEIRSLIEKNDGSKLEEIFGQGKAFRDSLS